MRWYPALVSLGPSLLPLPLPSKETRKGCVIVDSLLHLDEPTFPQLKTGVVGGGEGINSPSEDN